jgi:hypothetical protein
MCRRLGLTEAHDRKQTRFRSALRELHDRRLARGTRGDPEVMQHDAARDRHGARPRIGIGDVRVERDMQLEQVVAEPEPPGLHVADRRRVDRQGYRAAPELWSRHARSLAVTDAVAVRSNYTAGFALS